MDLKSSKAVKRALARLDTAVQQWYAENNPGNTMHYASVHICDSVEDGWHASRITLNTDAEGKVFIDIISSKQRGL